MIGRALDRRCSEHPADYTPEHGARFEVHFRKQRNAGGAGAQPIEAALSSGPDGRQLWTYRTLDDSTFDRVVSLARDGLRVGDIAAELGINKSNASRHLRKAKATGLVSELDR